MMPPARFLETLVSLSAQAAVLVAAAAMIVRRIESVRGRDALWSVCHLMLLGMALGDVSLPHLRLIPPFFSASAGEDVLLAAVMKVLGLAASVVWGTGALVALSRLAVGVVRNVRVLHGSVAAPEEWARVVADRLVELSKGDSAGAPVHLRVHSGISAPFCWQIQQPVIVVPTAMLSYPAEELCPILRHELAHLRLGHPLQLFLQQLVLAVFWFHPVVRWSARQAAVYRELDCDCQAVGSREEIAGYLRGLLRLARPDVLSPTLPELTLHFNARGEFLMRRAEELSSPRSSSSHRACEWRWIAIVPVIAILLTVSCWVTLDENASRRALWSPWPKWSATALHAIGFAVRDFEIDGHRRVGHEHHSDATFTDPAPILD